MDGLREGDVIIATHHCFSATERITTGNQYVIAGLNSISFTIFNDILEQKHFMYNALDRNSPYRLFRCIRLERIQKLKELDI